MSRGKKLQEMEVKTQQSKTVVNANAKPGDPMPTMADPGTQLGSVEDLGGPTPENYKVDDDSAKLKTPGTTLCLLYTSPSPRDLKLSRMPSSA